MSDFSVMPSAVGQASSATRTAGSELAAELARLRREADDVLTGSWRGRAATAFDRAWGSWDEGAREVVAGLDRLAELLTITKRSYESCDDRSAVVLRRAAS